MLLHYYVSLVLLLIAFLFHRLSSSFVNLLEGNQEHATESGIKVLMDSRPWLQISRKYRTLQKLADEFNSTFGTQITLFLMQFLIGFAVALNELLALSGEDWRKAFVYALWVLVSSLTLYWAADACRQVCNK